MKVLEPGSTDENDNDARLMLGTMLLEPASELFEDWSVEKKEFFIMTASATVIERTLCESCEYQLDEILRGFSVLVSEMKRKLIERCEEHKRGLS